VGGLQEVSGGGGSNNFKDVKRTKQEGTNHHLKARVRVPQRTLEILSSDCKGGNSGGGPFEKGREVRGIPVCKRVLDSTSYNTTRTAKEDSEGPNQEEGLK